MPEGQKQANSYTDYTQAQFEELVEFPILRENIFKDKQFITV